MLGKSLYRLALAQRGLNKRVLSRLSSEIKKIDPEEERLEKDEIFRIEQSPNTKSTLEIATLDKHFNLL